MNKTCQSCKNVFTITSDDTDFYSKIQVPEPTFCPDCRLQRRLSFRNERALHKRTCDLCGANTISMYAPEGGIVNYCGECWWGDKWDPMSYGQEYDFSKPFFVQFAQLMRKVPHQNLSVSYKTLENTNFTNMNHALKNCYYIFNSDYDESCYYSEEVEHSRECFDTTMIDTTEIAYESVNCTKCYQVYYSVDCESSHNVWFSKNLSGCSNCFGCVNLRGASYHIFNQKYSKEEYEQKIKELNLASHQTVSELKQKVKEFWLQFPCKYMHGVQNLQSTGDYVYHSKFVKNSFMVNESEYSNYCMWLIVKGNKECYDFTQFGENTERVYEALVCGKNINNVLGAVSVIEGRDLRYAMYCFNNNSNCFGCIGLRSKKYCILNKEYSKEEYEALLPKIIEHMNTMPYVDAKGRSYVYGDFFPSEISQFAYNETSAHEFFPLIKEEALSKGFNWRDTQEKNYQITIFPEQLPDTILEVEDSITGAIIGCEHKGTCNHQCATAFRILPDELQFYRAQNLPVPRLCPNCRHYERVKNRNPNKLWHRACMCNKDHPQHSGQCPNEFETSYEPNRSEIVYCESCYQQEVM